MVDLLFSDARLAALYDRMCPRAQRRDFDFYLPLVMAAEAVLDLGCGTGLMLHEARRAGHGGRLCGLDPAAGMLAQARKYPDIEWVRGDIVSAGWSRAFDLIVMTGHAFQVLVEDDDLRASLAAVRTALRPGGRFACETRNPAVRAWEDWTADRATEIADDDGAAVRVTPLIVAPFDGRTVSFTQTFVGAGWDHPLLSPSTLRFLSADELRRFLSEAGLMIEQQFGNWDRQKLTETSPEIITIARPDPRAVSSTGYRHV